VQPTELHLKGWLLLWQAALLFSSFYEQLLKWLTENEQF